MKDNMIETAVGAVVIVIAAAFFFYAYTLSGTAKGQGGYKLTAEFENIAGINVGSDVRMAGIKIGTVLAEALDPESYQALVTLSIDPQVQISDDTSAKITSEGLLGSSFIALDPGGSDTKLKDGDRLTYTQSALDIWKLVSDAMSKQQSSQQPTPPAEQAPQQQPEQQQPQQQQQ